MRLVNVHFNLFCARDHSFGRVRTHQLWPIFREQVGAGEDVGPDDASVDGDDHSDRVAVAQLADQSLIVLLDGLGDCVYLLADFLVLVDLCVGTDLRHLSRDRRRSGCDFDGHGLFLCADSVPDLLLVFVGHGFAADGRLRHDRHWSIGCAMRCAAIHGF